MSLHTPKPVQIDRLQACPDNKESLQVLCQYFLKRIAKKKKKRKEKKKEIILSEFVKKVCTDIDCVKCQEYVECLKQSSPTSKIEETDTGMIAHTHQAALEDFK